MRRHLLQLMLIVVLCQYVCGIPAEFVTTTILPAAALSILAGNAFYAWQAKNIAEATGRPATMNRYRVSRSRTMWSSLPV